ncbi:MAG: SA1362 family protein [Bacillus sp. (in: firmicutes)]
MKRFTPFIVALLLVAAGIGLVSQLLTETTTFLTSILISVIALGIIIYLISRFTTSSEQKAYRKAAKQTNRQKKTYSRPNKKSSNIVNYSVAHTQKKVRPKRKSDVHLTVIEGKKSKKNRA